MLPEERSSRDYSSIWERCSLLFFILHLQGLFIFLITQPLLPHPGPFLSKEQRITCSKFWSLSLCLPVTAEAIPCLYHTEKQLDEIMSWSRYAFVFLSWKHQKEMILFYALLSIEYSDSPKVLRAIGGTDPYPWLFQHSILTDFLLEEHWACLCFHLGKDTWLQTNTTLGFHHLWKFSVNKKSKGSHMAGQ